MFVVSTNIQPTEDIVEHRHRFSLSKIQFGADGDRDLCVFRRTVWTNYDDLTLTYREIVRERHWWLPAQWDPGVCGRTLGPRHQEFIPDLRYRRLILEPLPKSCRRATPF
ncbi:hypothetical protein G5I_08004 [Acromyrmex echinatior]|uniref:Uncharacterized protein n=1 Tax=Acromyrmex echinatior TaxID=103372 RepID=F4WQB5_ACREC|nr:hypothetical protein G5I_08004 [Acromyrmex echinatior]